MTEPGAARCDGCGVTVPQRPATWSMQVSTRGRSWLCERRTRDSLRAIEGKLEESWW